MIISIASIKVQLVFSREFKPVLQDIKDRFSSYILDDHQEETIVFKLHVTPSKHRAVAMHNRKNYSFYAARNYWVIIHNTSRCTLSWESGWAILQFWGEHDRLFFALQDYLKFIFACQTILRGGLPLHCSAVASAGRALVFFGPSGIGKTTIATLFTPEWTLLNDEFNIVLPDNTMRYRVYSTPFTKLDNLPLCSNGAGEVVGLFALRQSASNRVSSLTLQQAMFMLSSSCYTIPTTVVFGERMLETMHNLYGQPGVRQLSFINTKTVVQDMHLFLKGD